MHNILSHNQLEGWRQTLFNFERDMDRCNDANDAINDYFHCLVECDEDEGTCRRICTELLK
jgi:hypothetical protein